MARTLERLQKQYNSVIKRGQGLGGPGMRHNGAQGKPKNVKQTVTRTLAYAKGYELRFALVLLCMLIATVASLCGSYLLAPIVDKLSITVNPNAVIHMTSLEATADRAINGLMNLVAPGATGPMPYLIIAVLLLGAVYLIAVGASYLRGRLLVIMAESIMDKMRNDLFSKLQRLPVRYYDSHQTGEIMSRFTNDIATVDRVFSETFTSLIDGVVSVIGTLIFMFSTNWVLSLITVLFVPVFSLGGVAIGKISRKFYSAQQAALGAVNGYIEETVSGVKVVKVFNHEEEGKEEFNLLNNDMRDKQFRAQFWGSTMGPIMGNLSQVCYGITVGIGGLLLLTGTLTPGGLTVFAGYSRRFSQPINSIAMQMATIFAALAGAERVFEVIDEKPEPADKEDASSMPDMQGYVVMKDVTFGYVPEKTVLKHIDLYAKPGQKIAFVGSTGAGKTTVTNLLNRFYDIEEGTITIDDVNIQSIKRDVLRRNIAMVLQDTHLFTGTVMENIRYGRLDATDEEVIAAAKTASAHSFIMRLSDGYQTKLTGDGANLSQGQRQLLNIARAALSKAPILVLDEATSSVDTRTERHIEHGMDRLMKNRTTFVIAHRLSTVRNANAIMVLEQGEIIERGSHEDLLAMKGRYYELYTGKRELD